MIYRHHPTLVNPDEMARRARTWGFVCQTGSTIYRWLNMYEDFPFPKATFNGRRWWLRTEFDRWLTSHPKRVPYAYSA